MLDRLSHDPVLHALPVAAIVTDAEGRVVAWNPQAEVVYGWRADEVVGRSIFDLVAPATSTDARSVFDRVVTGEPRTVETPLVRRDGSSFLARASATAIRDETGGVIGVLGVSEDVTERQLSQASHTQDAERLRLALEAGRLGTWEYDARTGMMLISRRFEEILGLDSGAFGGTLAALDELVHPDDAERLSHARQDALDNNLDIHTEYRIVRPDGETRWIEGRGTLRVTGDDVVGSIGVVIDVTERHVAEQQRDALAARLQLQARAAGMLSELDIDSRLNSLADIIVPALADCCAIHLLEAGAIRLAGVRHADPHLQPFFRDLLETFPVSTDQPYGAGAVLRTGVAQHLPQVPDEVLVAVTADRPELLAGFRALDLTSGYVVPLVSRGRILGSLSLGRTAGCPDSPAGWTEEDRNLAEQLASTAAVALDNAQLYAAEHAARAAAEDNQRRLALLAEVTTTLVRSLDLEQVLDALAGLLVPRLAEMCAIHIVDGVRIRLAAVRAVDDRAAQPVLAAGEQPRDYHDTTAVAKVIRTGAPLLVANVDESYLRARATDDAQLAEWLTMDMRSAVVAPMVSGGRIIGALSMFGIGVDARRFDDDDVDLLVEIGRRAGLAIDNATLYGREHNLAEALQRSLLPDIKPLPGLDVAARYLPSSDHAQVGGDWFDAFPLDDGAVGIAVGDAMGHDPRASGAMGQLRSVLRSYAFEGAAPGVVLDKLDRLVQGFAMAQLATVFYGRLEPPNADGHRVLRYASAGHPPAILRRADGRSEMLDSGQSVVIGVPLDATDRPEASVRLEPGSLLVCYTDGLVEGRHRPIDEGITALRAAVETLTGVDADAACDRILSVLVGDTRDDDIAVLAVRTLG